MTITMIDFGLDTCSNCHYLQANVNNPTSELCEPCRNCGHVATARYFGVFGREEPVMAVEGGYFDRGVTKLTTGPYPEIREPGPRPTFEPKLTAANLIAMLENGKIDALEFSIEAESIDPESWIQAVDETENAWWRKPLPVEPKRLPIHRRISLTFVAVSWAIIMFSVMIWRSFGG